jgi:hypothetical protein
LNYDTNLGGYRINITSDRLNNAPKYRSDNDWSWNRESDQRVYSYYKARPYWE